VLELELPEEIQASGGSILVLPGARTVSSVELSFATKGPPQNEVVLTAQDEAIWHAATAITVTRAIYIESNYYDIDRQLLCLQVNCAPDEPATVTLVPPSGLRAAPADGLSRLGRGWLEFDMLVDAGKAASWTVKALAADTRGHQHTAAAELWRIPVQFKPDALHVYPLQTVVGVGKPVRIVVASGRTPATLCYLNGVGVSTQTGARYIASSFNLGDPGGTPTQGDGYWALLQPIPTCFLLPEDDLLNISAADGEIDQVHIDFNVTPVWSAPPHMSDSMEKGDVLFNFSLAFDSPGLYTLGVDIGDDPRHTFYSDWQTAEHCWHDTTNIHAGIPRKILVTD
jgi:hypothetical protein